MMKSSRRTTLIMTIALIIGGATMTALSATMQVAYSLSYEIKYDNPPVTGGTIGLHRNNAPGTSVTWYHNNLDLDDIAGTGERTEMQTAFNTWQNDLGSYIQFTNGGVRAELAGLALGQGTDTLNVVQYAATLECNGAPDPIAVTGRSSSPSTGIVAETDTAFNSFCFLFSNATPTPSNRFDLQTIGLHELGHGLFRDDMAGTLDDPPGPAENDALVMISFGTLGQQKRVLTNGDLAGVRFIYPVTNNAGNSIGSDQQGADLSSGLVNAGSTRDYVFAWAEAPFGANNIEYSYGWDINTMTGAAASWSSPGSITGVGDETQGVGVALQQINNDGNGRPDLVIAWMDNPLGANTIKYRIGWDVSTAGVPASWSSDKTVNTANIGSESQGLGIAFVDTADSGASPEMFVFWVDNPSGANVIYYKIGWNINTSGDPTGATPWSARINPNLAPGSETQGLGVSIGNWIGTANPDLIVFWIDNPSGNNHGYYRVGQDITATGTATWTAARDTFANDWRFVGTETQGAGVTLLNVNTDGFLDATFAWIDNPFSINPGYMRTEWMARMGTASHE